MKTMFALFLLAIASIQSASAIDEGSLQILKKQGFQVYRGELTGAGSKMSIKSLAGFIHPNGIVMKGDCKSIAVGQGSNQEDLKISDITKVVVDQSVISAGEFEGFFTK